MSRELEACPECESARIIVASTRKLKGSDIPKFYCNDCGERFDTPTERLARDRRSGPGHGETFGLKDMDPEDLGLTPLGER